MNQYISTWTTLVKYQWSLTHLSYGHKILYQLNSPTGECNGTVAIDLDGPIGATANRIAVVVRSRGIGRCSNVGKGESKIIDVVGKSSLDKIFDTLGGWYRSSKGSS